MHVQLFFDTCIIFNYINPRESVHENTIKMIDAICNPENYDIQGQYKDFRGIIVDIVETEFFNVIHYKINLLLEDIKDFYKNFQDFSEQDLESHLNLLKQERIGLFNLITFIMDMYNIKSLSDLKSFYEIINKTRIIFRKKYLQLSTSRKILFRKIPQKEKLALDLNAKKLNVSKLDFIDRKIIIYADFFSNTEIPSYLATIDYDILNQRMHIMQQLKKNLAIITPIEFGHIYLREK